MKKSELPLYLVLLITMVSCSANKQTIRLFAGKFTAPGEKGFCIFDMNQKEGTFNLLSESDAGPNPSYFCISGKSGLIYAANEVRNFNSGKGGGVTTLRYDSKTGTAEKIAGFPIPNGSPCFISLSPGKDYLFLANYSGSSVTVVKLDENGIPEKISDSISFVGEDGKISHPHMILSDPDGKRIYQTDLGLDQIVIYDFDASSGKLQQLKNGIVKLPTGSGPRHFVFNSGGTKMYVINELNSSLSVFNVDNEGGLENLQTISTLREDFKGKNSSADVHLSKKGDFLYGSNRGENTIVTFRIGSDGLLSLAGHTTCGGEVPRNFVIDPSGNYILVGNQRSGNITVFRINEKTGVPIEPGIDIKIKSPACLKF